MVISPKGVIIERVKPYNVKLVTEEIGKAPEQPEVQKHSVKENHKVNKFKRKQAKEFDNVDDYGNVDIPERLQPNHT